jgi:hypothetical protein
MYSFTVHHIQNIYISGCIYMNVWYFMYNLAENGLTPRGVRLPSVCCLSVVSKANTPPPPGWGRGWGGGWYRNLILLNLTLGEGGGERGIFRSVWFPSNVMAWMSPPSQHCNSFHLVFFIFFLPTPASFFLFPFIPDYCISLLSDFLSISPSSFFTFVLNCLCSILVCPVRTNKFYTCYNKYKISSIFWREKIISVAILEKAFLWNEVFFHAFFVSECLKKCPCWEEKLLFWK